AKAAEVLVENRRFEHVAQRGAGWWRPDACRYGMPPLPEETSAGGDPAILITGATGTLGRAFARLCSLRGLAFRVTSRDELDIGDKGSVAAALDRHRPWAVINTAGYVRVAEAEREAERCFRENTEGAVQLAVACADRGIPLVTFSSDLVFDGRLGRPYLERDEPCPTCNYGKSKAEAEKGVLAKWPTALVVRTSAFFGPWDVHNFVVRGLRTLAEGDEWHVSSDRLVS